MGNTVTVVKVHLGDGVTYYKPPVNVMDILTEHPEYVVVSMSKGRMNILSSDLHLQPGRNYHLVSPDRLFSATGDFQMPADHLLSCCYARCYEGCGKLHRIFAIYFASTKSLCAMLIPTCKPRKTKSSVMIKNLEDVRAGRKPGRMRSPLVKDECTEVPRKVTSLAKPDAPSAAAALTLRKRSSLKDMAQEVHSPTSDKAKCISSLFKSHETMANVDGKSSSKISGSSGFTTKTGNTDSEWGKESFCVPWKSSRRLELGGNVSQAVSKEQWLENMIRGADNQWNRLRLRQQFIIEDHGMSEIHHGCQPKSSWRLCVPSSEQSLTSSPKIDSWEDSEYHDSWQSQSPESSRGSCLSHSFDTGVVNKDQELKHEDHRNGPLQDFQGIFARTQSSSEEIEQIQQLELDERDGDSKHPLWMKMDAMERQCLMRPSPDSPSIAENSLQKFPGIDASTRPWSVNFSRLDRG